MSEYQFSVHHITILPHFAWPTLHGDVLEVALFSMRYDPDLLPDMIILIGGSSRKHGVLHHIIAYGMSPTATTRFE
jgi:hypothetical protein